MSDEEIPTSPDHEPPHPVPSDIPGAPAWAQEFYRRVHADVMLVLVEFQGLRDRVASLESRMNAVEVRQARS